AEVADVANVFHHSQVWIQTEDLREITGLRARFARGTAEHFHSAGGRFHHTGNNLKGRGLACAIRTDEAEDFAARDFQADSSHRLDRPVPFPKVVDADSGCASGRLQRCRGVSTGRGYFVIRLFWGHASP